MKAAIIAALVPFFSSVPVFSFTTMPVLLEAPVDKIFVIEEGFDTNDNAQVVIKGTFPNSCYQADQGHVVLNRKKKTIEVSATAYYYPQEICIQMQVPYIHVLKVGMLPKGQYTAQHRGRPELQSKFMVKPAASDAPDDFMYTPIDSAHVATGANGKQELILRGQYPHLLQGCMDTKQVKISYGHNQVLIVQPIASILPETECTNKPAGFFEIVHPLEYPLPEETLLHVRSLNGNAYNQLVGS